MELVQLYSTTIGAIGGLAFLLITQLLIADAVGIRAKHMPGSTVAADHDDHLFRVTRTVANTNESIAVFILAVLFCILSGAAPSATAYAAWAFVLARMLYALCYYSNQQLARSVIFAVSLLALLSLLAIGAMAWL